MESQNTPIIKTVMVLGGNGFIGSHIVNNLLSPNDGVVFNIYVLNRGRSWEWDTNTTIKSRVKCIKWDRKSPLVDCDELIQAVTDVGKYDCVLDMSGYDPEHVRESVEYFTRKTNLYIYISSDSVYEVCETTDACKTRECDSRRPQDKEKARKLKRRDSYGHKKLKSEEFLFSQSDVSFITLRLADVIGPKDSTDRFWTCLLWSVIASQLNIPVMLPVKDKNISVVYVDDIARLIKNILLTDDISTIINEAYNLACIDTCTVEELFLRMYTNYSKCVRESESTTSSRPCFTYCDKAVEMYPSVERGPIDVTKATRMLSWRPRSIDQVVMETVKFYVDVMRKDVYKEEKGNIVGTVLEDLGSMYTADELKIFKGVLYKTVFYTHD